MKGILTNMNDLKKIIANNIFVLRNQHTLTQQEFANKLNMSRGNISKIENGINMPSAEFIKLASELFEVPCDWLLNCNFSNNSEEFFSNKALLLAMHFDDLSDEAKSIIFDLVEILIKQKK